MGAAAPYPRPEKQIILHVFTTGVSGWPSCGSGIAKSDTLSCRKNMEDSLFPWVGVEGQQAPWKGHIRQHSDWFCVYHLHFTLQYPLYLSCPPQLSGPKIFFFFFFLHNKNIYLRARQWEESNNTEIQDPFDRLNPENYQNLDIG